MQPIFLATHPRSCSTAFERIFMTRSDLDCIHEPFGDPFYYGPERLSTRFEADQAARDTSGYSDLTYATVANNIEKQSAQAKRVFIKDIAYYLFPPCSAAAQIAPSMQDAYASHLNGHSKSITNGFNLTTGTINPTVLPDSYLKKFRFTFLIRHPRYSIPSYFRCTIPPLSDMNGFHHFMPSEAGYEELRRLFDYLRAIGLVESNKPKTSSTNGNHTYQNGTGHNRSSVVVLDADDMMTNPEASIKAYCEAVNMEYDPQMLQWKTDAHQQHAEKQFEKWKGFHEDALHSSGLSARERENVPSREEEDASWTDKYGAEGAKVIRETVNANVGHYEYLKQFAMTI